MPTTVREEARQIIDSLPESAGWEDVMYELYVREKIDRSLQAEQAGHIIDHDTIKNKYL